MTGLENCLTQGFHLHHGNSFEYVWHVLENGKDEDIVNEALTFVNVEENSRFSQLVGNSIYTFSTNELAALARLAGFQIQSVSYVSPQRYPFQFSVTDHECVLIAVKPI